MAIIWMIQMQANYNKGILQIGKLLCFLPLHGQSIFGRPLILLSGKKTSSTPKNKVNCGQVGLGVVRVNSF